jgi:hypothetical protein
VTTRTVVGKPGVSSIPMSFCMTYHAPSKKLKPAMPAPANDISCNGRVLKLTNPFKPIFREPVSAL